MAVELQRYRAHILWTSVVVGVLAIVLEILALSVNMWVWGVFYSGGNRYDYNYGLAHGSLMKNQNDNMQTDLDICCNADVGYCIMYSSSMSTQMDCTKYVQFLDDSVLYKGRAEQYLIPYAVYVVTVLALAAGGCFSVLSVVFGFINACCGSVARCTGACGLYIWNGCAAICLIVSLGMGGHMIVDYVPVPAFIEGNAVGYTVYMSYAYWLMLVAALCHLGNLSLVHSYRRFQ